MQKLIKQVEKQLNKLSDKGIAQTTLLWWGREENIGRILDSIDNGFVNKKTVENFLKNIKKLK